MQVIKKSVKIEQLFYLFTDCLQWQQRSPKFPLSKIYPMSISYSIILFGTQQVNLVANTFKWQYDVPSASICRLGRLMTADKLETIMFIFFLVTHMDFGTLVQASHVSIDFLCCEIIFQSWRIQDLRALSDNMPSCTCSYCKGKQSTIPLISHNKVR